MNRVWSSQLSAHVDERVSVCGWLHHFRRLKHVCFLVLRDAKGLIQIVVEDEELIARLESMAHESVLSIEALVVSSKQAPQGVELHQPAIELLSGTQVAPPFDLYRPVLNVTLPTLLDNAPLSLRHPHRRALARIAAESMAGFRAALNAAEFTEIQTPKIVAAATESGANVFEIDYFGKAAYLAQSPQFYKQMMVGVFERVFEVGPVFRAEPHDTARHLSQYVSLDAEFGFIENHRTVMAMLTNVLRGMVETIAEREAEAIALTEIRLPTIPDEIPVIHFSEALELIYRETGEDARHEPDLAPAHERWLCEWAQRTYGSEFLFVEGYPMVKRPFYTHPDKARPAYSNSFDLLFRGLELVTGGQRLHKYEDYIAALSARGLSPEQFAGYLDAFHYGMPPHGGFAIGLERWVARLSGAQNVREVTLFPRDLTRLVP